MSALQESGLSEGAEFRSGQTGTSSEAEAEALWLRLAALLTEADEATRLRNAAWLEIPSYLRDGPVYAGIAATGEAQGEQSGWPVLTDDTPPPAGLRRIRWSPDDLFKIYKAMIGIEGKDAAFSRLARDMAQLRERVDVANGAREARGIDRLDADVERLLAEVDDTQRAILELSCDGPRALAAQILVRWGSEQDGEGGPFWPANSSFYLFVFRMIAPQIGGGPLAEAVASALEAIMSTGASLDHDVSTLSGLARRRTAK